MEGFLCVIWPLYVSCCRSRPLFVLLTGIALPGPATFQELAAYAAMHNAVVAAVPSAPQDWLRKDESDAKNGEFHA